MHLATYAQFHASQQSAFMLLYSIDEWQTVAKMHMQVLPTLAQNLSMPVTDCHMPHGYNELSLVLSLMGN